MKKPMKKILSLVLSVLLLMSHINVVFAETGDKTDEGGSGSHPATFVTDVDTSKLNVKKGQPVEQGEIDLGTKNRGSVSETVRVSIVLSGKSTIDKGFKIKDIGQNKKANEYRDSLKKQQDKVAGQISSKVLGGEKLDVVWNLTLAANIISANVPSDKIEAIKKIPGVVGVYLENKYYPQPSAKGEEDGKMMISSREMTNSNGTHSSLYNGAGSKVAIVDTGLDIEHQSFDEDAFLHAIEEDGAKDKLMTAADLEGLNLNMPGVYYNAKIPYMYNYVDDDTDVTHTNDEESEHGSHVAGIAAANRYIKTDDGFVSAEEEVGVVGQAPDAQVFIMKVFGKNGGAYDSDYFSAVEDAITLGADSVNLSLGSRYPGFSYTNEYLDILNGLSETGLVMVTSSGNNTSWDYDKQLYADDINYQTGGSPGSFIQTFTVASIDTYGAMAPFIKFEDSLEFRYNDGNGSNKPLTTIAGEYEFIYIDSIGSAAEFAYLADEVAGRIALCNRGTTSFYQKAEAAVDAGALATVIVNNTRGMIGMDLSSYSKTEPVVMIRKLDGQKIKATAEKIEDPSGLVYYIGKVEIGGEDNMTPEAYYTMSDFSSWGVPGSLLLKPEITAPGGDVYSLNGEHLDTGEMLGGHDEYEYMSGTSMAAPQITGIIGVIGQYYRENNIEEKTGLSLRQFALSTLMSTAVPVDDADSGNYYSVLKQGAGLASVDDAVSAKAFIKMSEDDGTLTAMSGAAADYRVKAEVGDDPDRTGKFTYTFTLTNFSEELIKYVFSTDLFTQAIEKEDPVDLLSYMTVMLNGNVTYVITTDAKGHDVNKDGETNYDDVQAILDYASGVLDGSTLDLEAGKLDDDDEVTTRDAYLLLEFLEREAGIGEDYVILDGGETATVEVTIEVTDKELLDRVNGGYVEGYTFVESEDDVTYSIPVLGYYGSWTDPSMFDAGSLIDQLYGSDKTSYMDASMTNAVTVQYESETSASYLIGNPYAIEDEFKPERMAISSNTPIVAIKYNLIRNAANAFMAVTDEDGKVITSVAAGKDILAAYYNTQQARPAWLNTAARTVAVNKTPAQLGLKDGDQFTVGAYALPEYYGMISTDGETGNVTLDQFNELLESGVLGRGSYIGHTLTVDDEAPTIAGAEVVDEDHIKVTLSDNQYVAYLALMDVSGNTVYGEDIPEQSAANETIEYTFDVSGMNVGAAVMVFAADYAANETASIYRIAEGDIIIEKSVYVLTDKVVPGNDYLIVNTDKAGDGFAVSHYSDEPDVDAVTINPADDDYDAPYILDKDVESASVFTVEEGLKFINNGFYMLDVYELYFYPYDDYNLWDWDAEEHTLLSGFGEYLVFDGKEFVVSEEADSVFMYVRETTTEIFDPDKVDYVKVIPETAAILSGLTKQFKATVYPITIDDKTVTWSTSDETVATVDKNGLVTAVGEGTVEIIATANKDNTTFGSATLTVVGRTPIDATINAQITDANGTNFVRIDLNDSSYEVLGMAAGEHLGGGRSDDVIIGFLDDDLATVIYTTIEGDSYSSSNIGYFGSGLGQYYCSLDGAHIPFAVAFPEEGDPVVESYISIYASRYYLLLMTPGFGITGWSISGISALAYAGTDTETYGHYYYALYDGDLLILYIGADEEEPLDEDGNVNLSLDALAQIGIENLPHDPEAMSMSVLETEELYGLLIANNDNKLIYFVDLMADELEAVVVGGMLEATSLTTLHDDLYDCNLIAAGSNAAKVVERATMTKTRRQAIKAEKLGNLLEMLKKDEPVVETQKTEKEGGLNAQLNPVKARPGKKTLVSDDNLQNASGTSETDDEGNVTIEIRESDLTNNGLYTITYDPDALTYVGTDTELEYNSVNDAEEGTIRFAFADLEGVEADAVIATINFTVSCEDTTITVTTNECNEDLGLEDSTDVEVEGIGHDYGDPEYTWSEDNSTVTATRVCRNNEDHVETETVETTSKVTPPTCEEDGFTTFTAEFENEAFETQTKDVAGDPATGHTFGDPEYTWSDDHSEVTATRKCETCGHEESETAKTTVTEIPATTTEAGKIIYTVEFENEAFEPQTLELPGEPMIVYNVVTGADANWAKGSGADLLIVVERSKDDDLTFGLFQGIEIGGSMLGEDDFTAEAGSVKATINGAYLENLDDGTYTVKVLFEDGAAETTLTIATTPDTGDASKTMLYTMLLVGSAAAAAGTVVFMKRRKED